MCSSLWQFRIRTTTTTKKTVVVAAQNVQSLTSCNALDYLLLLCLTFYSYLVNCNNTLFIRNLEIQRCRSRLWDNKATHVRTHCYIYNEAWSQNGLPSVHEPKLKKIWTIPETKGLQICISQRTSLREGIHGIDSWSKQIPNLTELAANVN